MTYDAGKFQVLDEHSAVQMAELFRVLSDTKRIRTISLLIKNELNVSALADMVGVSHSSVSHHLRSLRRMRLVSSRKSGKEVYYQVNDFHMIDLYQRCLERIFLDRLRGNGPSFQIRD
jgi:ArsR family transcriptional regulator, lead/cadmium/zinc/bismuth-responsive transcriptional repressor